MKTHSISRDWLFNVRMNLNLHHDEIENWQRLAIAKIRQAKDVPSHEKLPIHRKRNIQKLLAYEYFLELNSEESDGPLLTPISPEYELRQNYFRQVKFSKGRVDKAARNPFNAVLHRLFVLRRDYITSQELGTLSMSDQDRSKFAMELHYAWLCDVSPSLLLGFIWQEGNADKIGVRYKKAQKRYKKEKANAEKRELERKERQNKSDDNW